MSATKHRNWTFTLNNYTAEEQAHVEKYMIENCSYGIYGKEIAPETKTPHLQGYLRRKVPVAYKHMQTKVLPRAHWEVARGDAESNKKYCSKEDTNPYVFGDPAAGEQAGKRNDIATIKDMVKEGKGMGEIIDMATSYQAMRCAELILKYKEKPRDFKPTVLWFYGETGKGKTYNAVELMKASNMEFWISNKNLAWWEGYDAHPGVIIDDFRKDFCTFHELLRILDRYEYRIMNKGGSRQLIAKYIIITSPKGPLETYIKEDGTDREDIGQLLRRIDYTVRFPCDKWPWT